MIGIVIFNVLMILLGAAVSSGLVPARWLTSMLDWLHSIIGITPPAEAKARVIALIWIGSLIVIVDSLLCMLVLLTRIVM